MDRSKVKGRFETDQNNHEAEIAQKCALEEKDMLESISVTESFFAALQYLI
jgi:hypothetical protein